MQEIYWRRYLWGKMRKGARGGSESCQIMMQVWPQWRREGRMVLGRKHLRRQCISEEVQWGCWEILQTVFHLRSPFSPRNSPNLVFLQCSVRLEVSHDNSPDNNFKSIYIHCFGGKTDAWRNYRTYQSWK